MYETENNVETKEVTGKLIFNQRVAKRLLAMGNDLISIEKNKRNRSQTVFIFRLDDKLRDDLGKATERNEEDENPKVKLVSNVRTASRLLQEGYKVVDINPSRDDFNKTVFLFESSDDLIEEIDRLERRRGGEKTIQVRVKTA
jgi:hypothetical protein